MSKAKNRFRTDELKLRRLRVAAGMSVNEVTKRAEMDRGTIRKIMTGQAVFLSSIEELGIRVFGITNPMELLHPEELAAMGVHTEVPSPSHVLEWNIEEYLSGWTSTSNELQYQPTKLRHRFLDHRLARGKCYELRHLAGAERARVEACLLRHVEVCEAIGSHTNIARNLTAAPVDGVWWVIDDWVEGCTLQDELVGVPLNDFALRVTMCGIAAGLAAMEKAEVVRRELTPASILIRDSNNHPVLTDLELAKVLAAPLTVSPQNWPDDPYRALEVGSGTPIDVKADIYSWGRIFVHAATGKLPGRGEEQVPDGLVSNRVRDIVHQSVAIAPSQRPANWKAVLRALKGWL